LNLGTNTLINGATTRGGISGASGLTYDTADSSAGVKYFPTVSAFVEQYVNPRLSVRVTDSFTRSDEPSQADAFGLRQQRQTFTSNSFTVSARYLIDIISTQTYYTNSVFSSGGTDTIAHIIGTSASRPLGAANTISAGYQFSHTNTSGNNTSGNNANTSIFGVGTSGSTTGNTIFGSFSRQLTLYQTAGVSSSYTWLSSDTDNARLWNVSLFSTYGLPSGLSLSSSIGYTQVSSDNQDTTGGVTTNSTLSYRWVRAAISLGVFQDFRQTAVQGQNFGIVQTTGFTGTFSYVITPVITTNLFATYTTNDATGVGNNASTPSVNTLTTGAGLNWQLLRWLAMRLQYTYTQYGRGGNASNGTSSSNGVNGTGNTSVNQASVGFFSSF
jgi:hypothetical protein